VTDRLPLYNSKITKTYLEYIKKSYPDLDLDAVLEYAEMTKYEVEDPAHWFSQHQADRFQEVLVKQTDNPNIAREAGRYTTSHEGMGPAKQHILGFIKPTSVYLIMEKLYPILSRGATIKAKKLGPNKVEIVSTPKRGVNEKPYQCENRIGIFESLAELFTNKFANIQHPMCFHVGDKSCHYIITWEKTASIIWKRIRNYSLLISIIISMGLFFVLPLITWSAFTLLCFLVTMFFSFHSDRLEKKELSETIKTQGDTAKDLLDEMNIRHNNALLLQEIGKATSSIIDIDKLIKTVVRIMEMHIDFDRGMIMLADSDRIRLSYTAGYGYVKEKEKLLQQAEFHLDNPESTGVFVVAFKDQKPILVNDIAEIEKKLSKRSLKFAKEMGAKSLICVPIVYENESLGLLAVDNIRSKRPLTKSDMNFMMGIASQTAVSINNAMSFQQLQESEKKYRELVENANSIIMRRDVKGNITFFNEFAQK
jgi:PAS domain-containing protein